MKELTVGDLATLIFDREAPFRVSNWIEGFNRNMLLSDWIKLLTVVDFQHFNWVLSELHVEVPVPSRFKTYDDFAAYKEQVYTALYPELHLHTQGWVTR